MIWIFFGWSIFPDKMKTTYIAIFPAYKLVTSTACPYPNLSFFVRFLGIWKAIKRYYRSFDRPFQTFWISCIAFTSTPSTSLYHLKRYIFICVFFEFTVQIHKIVIQTFPVEAGTKYFIHSHTQPPQNNNLRNFAYFTSILPSFYHACVYNFVY